MSDTITMKFCIDNKKKCVFKDTILSTYFLISSNKFISNFPRKKTDFWRVIK